MFQQKLQLGGVQGGGYDPGFHVKSARFHMKYGGFHQIERPLARNCNPMFFFFFACKKIGHCDPYFSNGS